jgi:hypothetical protein
MARMRGVGTERENWRRNDSEGTEREIHGEMEQTGREKGEPEKHMSQLWKRRALRKRQWETAQGRCGKIWKLGGHR